MKNVFVRSVSISLLAIFLAVGLIYSLVSNLKLTTSTPSNGGSLETNPLPGPSLSSEEGQVVALVEKSTPGVVSIVLTKKLPVYEQYYGNPFNDPFACQFLGQDFCNNFQVPHVRQNGTQEQEVGAGTGFFVQSDGLILTNKHVVEQADVSYTVVTNDGKKYPAKVLARDPVNDLALVKIDGTGFTTLPLGDSGQVKLGQTVVAIGNALGQFSNTVSRGIVSGLSRSISAQGAVSGPENLSGLLQTDAAINPGNSGGPLLNLRGEVIGINTAVAGGAQSVGFALPVSLGKRVVSQFQTQGKITYPFLGIRYMVITPDYAKAQNLSVDYGALIVRGQTAQDLAVVPGSPADKAGLGENDIILEASGKKITSDNSLDKIISSLKVGDTITLKVYSRGQTRSVSVILGERS